MSELVSEVWMLSSPVHQFLSAVAISLVSAVLLGFFKQKVKIVWGSANLHAHRVPAGDTTVFVATEKFYVQNLGKKGASRVEIIFSGQPSAYTVYPPRDYEQKMIPEGKFSISFPSLAPSELLIVDTIDVDSQNLKLEAVLCADVMAKQVNFMPQRQFGNLFNATVVYLVAAGFVGTVYVILKLIVGALS